MINENKFLICLSDGSVREIQFDENKKLLEQTNQYYYNWMPMTKLDLNRNSNLIMCSSKDSFVYLWENNVNNKLKYQLIGHKDVVTSCKFLSDNLIASSSYDQTVKFYKL